MDAVDPGPRPIKGLPLLCAGSAHLHTERGEDGHDRVFADVNARQVRCLDRALRTEGGAEAGTARAKGRPGSPTEQEGRGVLQSTMRYDRQEHRWCVGRRDLHCGDGIEVRVSGRWVPVRVEWQDRHGWVLFAADDDAVRLLPSSAMVARMPH